MDWLSYGRFNQRNQGSKIPDIICYEKQEENWGGLWNYSGEQAQTVETHVMVLCIGIWSNGPKGGEFSDYAARTFR